jgi:hypothetical protein
MFTDHHDAAIHRTKDPKVLHESLFLTLAHANPLGGEVLQAEQR